MDFFLSGLKQQISQDLIGLDLPCSLQRGYRAGSSLQQGFFRENGSTQALAKLSLSFKGIFRWCQRVFQSFYQCGLTCSGKNNNSLSLLPMQSKYALEIGLLPMLIFTVSENNVGKCAICYRWGFVEATHSLAMVQIKSQSFPNAHLCVAIRQDNCQRIIVSLLEKDALAKLFLSFGGILCWRQCGFHSFCQRGLTCVSKSSNFCDFCQRCLNMRWK